MKKQLSVFLTEALLTGFYKTEIRPFKAMCKRTQQLPTATTQQHATTYNRVCKRTQNVTSNNVASVCTRLFNIRTSSARTLLRRNKIKYTTHSKFTNQTNLRARFLCKNDCTLLTTYLVLCLVSFLSLI